MLRLLPTPVSARGAPGADPGWGPAWDEQVRAITPAHQPALGTPPTTAKPKALVLHSVSSTGSTGSAGRRGFGGSSSVVGAPGPWGAPAFGCQRVHGWAPAESGNAQASAHASRVGTPSCDCLSPMSPRRRGVLLYHRSQLSLLHAAAGGWLANQGHLAWPF